MPKIGIESAIVFLLCSCAVVPNQYGDGDVDCNETLCGCSRTHTQSVTIKFLDNDANPIPDASLICLDTGENLGWTDSLGLVRVRAKGRMSFCGFSADCRTAYFQTKKEGNERPFWFGQLLRGQKIDSVERSIEIVADGA